MKCLLMGKSEANPATRYRLRPLLEILRARGDEVITAYEPDFQSQLQLSLFGGKYDLVFIQRKLLSVPMLWLLRRRTRHLVFDFDDAIFLRSSGVPSRTRRRKFRVTISAADLVFAGNSYLVEAAGEHSGRIDLLPTSVDVDRYHPRENKLPGFTLVWIGSRSTSRYLASHRDMLEALGAAIPDLTLRVIGDFTFSLNNMAVENVPWSALDETRLLEESHVGIAPMDDDRWTRGKCALKVIQYMAAGLPVVSSAVGANRDVISHGETGYLAASAADWIKAVQTLHASRALRTEMGTAARHAAASGFSRQAFTSQLLAGVDQLLRA